MNAPHPAQLHAEPATGLAFGQTIAVPAKRHRPERTETIEWKDPDDEMPDAEQTCLCLWLETQVDGDPVDKGFTDGANWFFGDGMPAPRPHRWAHWPEGKMA